MPTLDLSTESKAFLKSINAQYNRFRLHKVFVIIEWRANIASRVPQLGLNPNWASVITSFVFDQSNSLLFNIDVNN